MASTNTTTDNTGDVQDVGSATPAEIKRPSFTELLQPSNADAAPSADSPAVVEDTNGQVLDVAHEDGSPTTTDTADATPVPDAIAAELNDQYTIHGLTPDQVAEATPVAQTFSAARYR